MWPVIVRSPVAMEQSMQAGVIGVVLALSAASTMGSVIPDRDSVRSAVYALALKSELGDLVKELQVRKLEGQPVEVVQGRSKDEAVDENQWLRKTRSDALPATWRQALENNPCTHMVPWLQALIQGSEERGVEGTYSHVSRAGPRLVPRATFIKRSTPSLPYSNEVPNDVPNAVPNFAQMENMEKFIESSVDHRDRAWCVPLCPIRASLLPVPPDPGRLLPPSVQMPQCACDETRCSGRYQCLQAVAPIFTVRPVSGNLSYCVEWIPAGCRCVPVPIQMASTFDSFSSGST